jgi:hypothetical protein
MHDLATPNSQSQFLRDYAGRLVQCTSVVHSNLSQQIVLTSEDKLRLSLTKHLSRMEKRRAWITPLGILLTIVIVFPTTRFQAFLLSAQTWEAVFRDIVKCCGSAFIVCVSRAHTVNGLMLPLRRSVAVHLGS